MQATIREMSSLQKRVGMFVSGINKAWDSLDIDSKITSAEKIEQELAKHDAWDDSEQAQTKSKQLAGLKAIIEPWQNLKNQSREVKELLEMGDEAMVGELEKQISTLEAEFAARRKDLLFNGPYDDHNAILRLTAGVGGTDAQDWAEMLERMYLRWAEKSGMSTKIIGRSTGDEAGLKTSVIEFEGPFVYGKLRSENGVHRLVRLSPFNSDNLRQTSFALVEVLPQIDTPNEVKLDEKDLKIDVYRAGGHGGQSVNTTDSAVRVTHIPTNIVVAIQNERSQLQNRETALKFLRSKLVQLQLEQHAKSISDLQAGESANWGSQIRSYVLHPYTIVKDTRTKYEETNASKVLDGNIEGFIEAYLDQNIEN